MLKRMLPFIPIILLSSAVLAVPVEKIDSDVNTKIREEGMNRSQIMRAMHFITDVYGPRLTGSPNHKAAAEWAIKQMQSWGMQNGHLEAWDFGHPGWLNERFTAHAIAPFKDALVCEVLAWTPGTDGPVRAQVVQIIPPERPTQEELSRYLDGVRESIKGRMVLVGKHTLLPVTITPPQKRRDDEQTRRQYDPNNPNAGQQFQRPQQAQDAPAPGKLTAQQVNEQIDQVLVAQGARVKIMDAAREHGQIRAFSNRSYDLAKAVPTVVMRNEDYGRISRILADGTPVELEFDIFNKSFPEGRTSYNTIAEIPGTDKKDEVVMLGAHFDSWHSATGATDNGIGSTMMMEAARIISALGLKPRRTIRVALWSGEEQGLLGSKAYVKQHFGAFEEPKPEFFKFGGYFNIDSGTGRARGASIFGPPETATVLREILAPFEDFGIMGALSTKSRRSGGTDSTSFNAAGLPGIGLGQDPIEYQTHTWHTNLDTYERIIEDDAKKSAVAIASAVYHLATREEMLPRFRKEDMPPPASPQPAERRP